MINKTKKKKMINDRVLLPLDLRLEMILDLCLCAEIVSNSRTFKMTKKKEIDQIFKKDDLL
jgi:hypothetical protein